MLIFWLILGFLILLNVLWAWHADWTLRRESCSWKIRLGPWLLAAVMGGGLALFFLSRDTGLPIREWLPRWFVTALYLWHLLVLPGWLLLAPTGVVAAGVIRRWKSGSRNSAAPAKAPGMDRRQFVRTLAATAPPAALLGLTGISLPQLNRFRVRELEIPLTSLPRPLDGLTLAHVSDTHVGVFTGGPKLNEIVAAVNQLDPDLALITGDVINDDLDDLPEAIDMVRSMKARHGVFLCEGNHDLIPGPKAFERQCKAAGLNLLVNEQRSLTIRGEPVQLLGLRWGYGDPAGRRGDDYGEGAIGHSMRELLRLRDPAAFPILLAHHPHAFDHAAEAGIPLTVAGHTHGGQLMVNENLGFGPALYRYWSGLYRIGESAAVISNGVGNWFPLRTAAPAEILRLTLRRKI